MERQEQEKQRREQMLVRLQRLRRRDPYEGVRLLPTRCCHLYPGSKFEGKQQSGTNSYGVVVDIKVKKKKRTALPIVVGFWFWAHFSCKKMKPAAEGQEKERIDAMRIINQSSQLTD